MRVESGGFRKIKRMSRAHVSEADEEAGVVLLCSIQPLSDMTVSGNTNKQL